MQKYINTVQNRSGQPVTNALITVRVHPMGSTATIYSDNGVTVTSNPTVSDINGAFSFYAADGRYDLTVTGSGIQSVNVTDILLEDPLDGSPAVFSTLTVTTTAGLPAGVNSTVGGEEIASLTDVSTAVTNGSNAIYAAFAASSGSSLTGFIQSGTGAVSRTAQSKMRESVSIMDFGAVGDGIADDTIAIQTAVNSGATSIVIPAGHACLFTSNITLPADFTLHGPGALKPSTTSAAILMPNNNTILNGVKFVGTVDDILYTVAIDGLTPYFSNSSLVTGGGALSSVGGVSGNNLTLGFVTDSGTAVTEVFSNQIAIDALSRYVLKIDDEFVTSGFVAGEMKIRAFDAGGVPIVGSTTETVDAGGYYNYINPTTYTLGNYLFLENASFVQFSFAVQRDANQTTGNTCVFDMSKVKFLKLTGYLATSPKTSLDNLYVVQVAGTNNIVRNCLFKNLPDSSITLLNSTKSVVTKNTIYNCLSGLSLNGTTDATISDNTIIAEFGGYGNRAYRWKSIGGINNTNMFVSNNTCKGHHWGFELIRTDSLLYNGGKICGNQVDSISTAMSLSGHRNAVISGNTCNTHDLSKFVLEFPYDNFNCVIADNTLLANIEMTQSIGISGVGGVNPNSSIRITNNMIRATIGITGIYTAPANSNSNFNIIISGNSIEYGGTGIYANFGDIRVENNTLFPINKGGNRFFINRTALQLSGSGFSFTTYCRQNVINSRDGYASFGDSTRLLNIQDNNIVHNAVACAAIHYHNFAAAATVVEVSGNTITTAYTGKYIEFLDAPFAGSSYKLFGNTGGTAKINVNNLPLSSSLINVGSDPLLYSGTVTPAAGAFAVTVDAVKFQGSLLTAVVHNGDSNHVQYVYQKVERIVGSVNTLNASTNIQTGSSGTLVTALTVDTSTGNIEISGTNGAGLNGVPIPYIVNITQT